MSLPRVLHNFFSRPRAERRLLLDAVVWLALMRAAILCVPFRRITRWLHLQEGVVESELSNEEYTRAVEIARMIALGSARTPWLCTCLTQTLAGMVLLRRHGLTGTLYLGVTHEKGAIAAHSWLSCGSRILIGDTGDMRYAPIARFTWQVGKRSSQ